MNKRNLFKYLLLVLLVALCFIVLSYSRSKISAIELIASYNSEKYFHLSKTRLSVLCNNNCLVAWKFYFSHNTIFDADFDVYTSIFGKVVGTSPPDLVKRLAEWDKMDIHPYSPEGRKKAYEEMIKKQIMK